jgi:hypothetical protein
LSLLLAGSAMAQVSGPLVDAPALMGTSESVAVIAMRGEAAAFAFRGFRISRSHEIEKATNDSLRKSALRTLAPSLTVPANAPFTQNTNYLPMGAPISANFEALGVGTPGFVISGAPPDTTLAVSDTQIVQWVNTQLAVYNKSGSPLLPSPGFVNGNQIWATLPVGSLCREFNQGDPILQFDRMARRWILSQFAFNGDGTNNAQCIAVSHDRQRAGRLLPVRVQLWHGVAGLRQDGSVARRAVHHVQHVPRRRGVQRWPCVRVRQGQDVFRPAGRADLLQQHRPVQFPAGRHGWQESAAPGRAESAHLLGLGLPPCSALHDAADKFKPDFVTPANSTFNDGQGGAAFSSSGSTWAPRRWPPAMTAVAVACVQVGARPTSGHAGQPPHVPARVPQLRHATTRC